MPHITIEYSANVAEHHDVQALVDTVHAAALSHGLPALDALRTRAARREHYRIADGDPSNAFVAITARIGPGRDADTKASFVEAILDAAEQRLTREASQDASPLTIAWSADVIELDPTFRINRNHIRTRIAEQTLGGRS